MKSRLTWPDAPVQLRDDLDRDTAIDHLWVMPFGPERDRARAAIVAATARRISDAIAEDRQFVAARLLDQLMWMWHADPTTIGRGLASQAGLLHRLRGLFAKAGALEPALQTLVALAEIDREQRATHLAEIDEILDFADDLARAEHGPHAERSQPLSLLQPVAVALPLPWLVDRYVALLVERQVVVSGLIDKQGASMQLVRAHQDILNTARRISIVLARAGRTTEIHRHLVRVKGIGADRELAIHAEIVAEAPTPGAFLQLASELRHDDSAPDAAAALAVGLAGLARFPGDPSLLAAAGGDARTLGRIDQAILLYEDALRRSAEVDTTIALRLGKLYADRIARLASNGRPRAASSVWRDVQKFTAKAARQQPHMVWQQTAAIAETALGKGLASQGLIREGRRALTASLERAPSIDALETLATIDIQTGRFDDGERWARSGIALLGERTIGDRYRRAKLERIAADAHRRAGRSQEAAARYLESLRTWASLGESKDLPRGVAAERLLDSARSMWWLGDAGKSVELAMGAVDHDPEAPVIAAGAVAFLIEVGRYRDAVDACHRGLGAAGVGDLYKVYMSLWIIAEGRRLGEPRDHLASEYLANRRGGLWYELLARAASGTLPFERLRAAATTGPRRGELAFYGAVLGLDPEATTPAGRKQLLQQAVEARVVFDAEYDLARRYLRGDLASP